MTYYWPPAGGSGVQRWLKFAKYLCEFGWDPIIITPENGSYPYYDHTLLEDIPEGLRVIKTKTRDPFRIYNLLQGKKGKATPVGMIGIQNSKSIFKKLAAYIRANFFIPDARVGWNKYALKAAKEVLKTEDVNVVVTTGPPHSTHLVGLELKKKLNVKWLADFRDPWTNIYYNKYLPRAKNTIRIDQLLEKEVISNANAVTVVSPQFKEALLCEEKQLEVLPNGFDEDDINMEKYIGKQSKSKFVISYVGNMMPNQDVPILWKVISELAEKVKDFRNFFLLKLTGNIDPSILKSIEDAGIMDMVEISGFVPHNEAVLLMKNASLLLFVVPDNEHNKLIVTGKIFEYLASRTPIVSIGPVEGEAANILKDCRRDEMINYYDKELLESIIFNYWDLWIKNKAVHKHENKNLKKYTRKDLTIRLVEVLDNLT